MTKKNSIRLLAIVLMMAMMLPFASCELFNNTGSLKLESFIIDPTSIKTEYSVGDEVDLSGIQATAKYSDESLNKTYGYSELTISGLEGLTATAGNKQITVSFMDPHLNVKQEATITIKVLATDPDVTTPDDPDQTTPPEGTTPDPVVLPEVVECLKPTTLVHFDSANKNAGTLTYGQAGFSGQFAVGGQVYVIGNENEFKLNPGFAIWDEAADNGNGDIVELKEFYTTVQLFVKDAEENYVELTAKEADKNIVEYYNGDVLMATVNTYKGTYQFTADAADKLVKISVLPSEEKYVVEDVNPVVLEAKVINAYNVYEAWQLAVVDNFNAAWTDFKAEKGLTNVSVSGIVLHNDIKLTADDAPASFFYTTTADVVYTNTTTGATVTIPAGTKYLVDGTMIYERRGSADFVMEGNFFTLDTKDFPLVPSPGVFGKDAGRDYGIDFSNAALFRILIDESIPEDIVNVTINNISLIGNAARDNFVDSTESLASAGGLIFLKSSVGAITNINNVIGNSYFITYFTEYKTTLTVTDSKCYDSYQNAVFMWGDATLNLVDTYINGCGGPAVIAQSVWNENRHPIFNATGGIIETHLGGQEIWFNAVQATAIVGQIKGLGAGLQQAGLGNFVDANGQMNIKATLMATGYSADEIVSGLGAQGSLDIDGDGISRFQSAENVEWMTILQISQYAAQMTGSMPPFLTVYDAQGTAYTVYYNGTTFVDLAGNAFGTQPAHQAMALAFMQADQIVLTQGGLSVVFEYYHY